MLIKIDGDRYINSEHISMIAPSTNKDDNVYFIAMLGHNFESEGVETTAAVVAYLALILDADENYSNAEVSLSLTSQIAIHLSNSAEAQTLNQLLGNTAWIHATPEDIQTSLDELLINDVIRCEVRDSIVYYSHAANAHPFEDLAVLDNGDSAW